MEKYQKYKFPISNETMDEICNKKTEYELLTHQKFLGEYLFDKQNINGLLIFHTMGSGKTCTAINITEKFKYQLKIIIVLPASLIGNFRNELRSKCPDLVSSKLEGIYISNVNREKLKKLKPNDPEYIKIIKESDKLIDKIYNIYSYQKFIKLINTPINETGELFSLDNSLLIIDEIQNMISLSGVFYNSLKYIINKKIKLLKIFLLTGTPIMDNPNEIGLLFNLFRPKKLFPVGDDFNNYFYVKNNELINLDEFKQMSYGLVSYFRGDAPIAYPKKNIYILRCLMSDFQLKLYKLAIRKEKKKNKNISLDGDNPIQLSGNFFLGPRIIANISFPNGKTGNTGFNSIKYAFNNMKYYSIKFHIIYKKVQESTGPIFIYSQFLDTGGLKSLIEYFEFNGYQKYDNSNNNNNNNNNKKYAMWCSTESLEKREKIKIIYNKYENKDGSLIKILFGSPASKEGISLLRVEQVHILEPYWNMSRIKQIIARAVRYCSHKDLPKNQRTVDIFIYLAMHHSFKSIDEYIWSMAKKKEYRTNIFEHALKEVAIDCNLFYNRNYYSTDRKQIICNYQLPQHIHSE